MYNRPPPLPGARDVASVLVLCPSDYEVRHSSKGSWASSYDVRFFGGGLQRRLSEVDAGALIEHLCRLVSTEHLDGIASANDDVGQLLAAAVAYELGLPGPNPVAVLGASHKYYSRLAQAEVVPEVTPGFRMVHIDSLQDEARDLTFPVFVKPVRSSFSRYARRIDDVTGIQRYAASRRVREHLFAEMRPFDDIAAKYSPFEPARGHLLVEELLTGHQVTVEGYVHAGKLQVLGVTDTHLFENTGSFQRFDTPSLLDPQVLERMVQASTKLVAHLGFDQGALNLELMYDPYRDRLAIVELNPRISGGFSDLIEAVRGVSTYEVMLALAVGNEPPASAIGSFPAASSFPLRHFKNARVSRLRARADSTQMRELRRPYPRGSLLTRLEILYDEGSLLSDGQYEFDGSSYRFGLVNLAGASREAISADYEVLLADHLEIELETAPP